MKQLLILALIYGNTFATTNPYNTTQKMPAFCFSNAQVGTYEFGEFMADDMPVCWGWADAYMKRKMKTFKEFSITTNLDGCITPKTVGNQMTCRQLYVTYMQSYMQSKVMNTPLKGK